MEDRLTHRKNQLSGKKQNSGDLLITFSDGGFSLVDDANREKSDVGM